MNSASRHQSETQREEEPLRAVFVPLRRELLVTHMIKSSRGGTKQPVTFH